MSLNTNGYSKTYQLTQDDVIKTADFLKARIEVRPQIGIICGTGLGGLADLVKDQQCIDYREIPNFPISTAPSHVGRLVFGHFGGKSVVCMQGRVHMYEGYPLWKITFPVRVMKELGVEALIVTNAGGGLNPDYSVGDIMIMKDHINLPGLAGMNPLIGLFDSRLGPRFPAMSEAYDSNLRNLANKVATDLGYTFVREGVYVVQTGPMFETVTECRMMRNMGADVTGMSTVPEVLVARQIGIKCLGISLVTNMCVMEYNAKEVANVEEVLETGKMRGADLQNMVTRIVEDVQLA